MRKFLCTAFLIMLAQMSCKDSNPVNPSSHCDSDPNLVGNWKGQEGIDTFSFSFTDNSYTWREGLKDDPTSAYQYNGTYCLDTSAVPHKIDMHINRDNTNQATGMLQMGIYSITIDTLRVSAPGPGVALRPTRFDSDSFVTYKLVKLSTR